jgi:hypothetical protein
MYLKFHPLRQHIDIRTISLFIFLSAFAFTSCNKNVAGPKGEPGESGKLGNSRQNSVKMEISASTWNFNGTYYSAKLFVPEITEQVNSGGEVKVYMKLNGQWWSLPYAVGDLVTQASFEKGYLHLKYFKIHGVASPYPATRNYRVVTFSTVQ